MEFGQNASRSIPTGPADTPLLGIGSACSGQSQSTSERQTESSGSTERFRGGDSGGKTPFTPSDMALASASASGEDASPENALSAPRSPRVGITGPPSSFRLSTSTTDTSESTSYSTPPSSPSLFPSTPPRPPRSPLRPTGPTRRASASLLKQQPCDVTIAPEAGTDEMPLSHSRSFGSFSGLLTSQPGSIKSTRSLRAPTPDKPLPITPIPSSSVASVHDDDHEHEEGEHPRDDALSAKSATGSVFGPSSSSGPSSLLQIRPAISKRVHALEELLSSERAYASDLALIRDIHIPLALGQPAPFHAMPETPPSSRTQSTSSDPASGLSVSVSVSAPTPSADPPSAPMTREDVRIIFSNVADIAAFSDTFTEQIEEALGSVLEGGTGEDRVGALFLETISTLEPLYLAYITRHDNALEHLSNLPQTPALTAYLAQSRALAASLTHAWDLPSLLIKPVQRLLKYALLLGAVIEETPDAHPDKANLKLAREKMEEVAHGVNEGRRRREVVKEVLSAPRPAVGVPIKRHSDLKPKAKKKGLNIGVSASVSLGRMKSLSMVSGANAKLKENKGKESTDADMGVGAEAEQVLKMGKRVKDYESLARKLARDAVDWIRQVKITVNYLNRWSKSFARVIGVVRPEESEAFDAFLQVIRREIPGLCDELEQQIKAKVLDELAKLVDSTLAPLRLAEAMKTLEPLHLGLLDLHYSKSRPPPQLLEASQSYLALSAQLAAELPQYLTLMDKGIALCIRQFSSLQMAFCGGVRDRWIVLWNALKVEGEMNAGAAETIRVWFSRFADVESSVLGLNIVHESLPELKRPKSKLHTKVTDDTWSESSSTVIVSSILTALDPTHEPLSSPSTLSLQTPVSTKARSVRSMDVGKLRTLERRNSAESARSKKSGKSAKSTKSVGHNPNLSVNSVDPEDIDSGYDVALASLENDRKPKYTRTKSMPIPAPLQLKKSHSQGRLLNSPEITRMKVPQHVDLEIALERQYVLTDRDRGRPSRKPSFKRRLTETLLPGSSPSSWHRRSPSLPIGLSPSPSPSPNTSTFVSASSSSHHSKRRPSHGGSKIPALYGCRVVHVCEPPPGVAYRDLPFFTLRIGNTYDVLQEAGHPSTHENLPLYVDDGEDCLLLVRNDAGDIGWALASFLVPVD